MVPQRFRLVEHHRVGALTSSNEGVDIEVNQTLYTLLTSPPGFILCKISVFVSCIFFFYTYVHKSVRFHAGCTSSTGVGGYLDGEGALGSVGLQVDLHGSRFTSCCDQFVTQFFQSVATIRDELPDEHLVGWGAGREDRLQFMNLNVSLIMLEFQHKPSYLFLWVQGPCNNVQQLFRLSLKFMFGETTWINQG